MAPALRLFGVEVGGRIAIDLGAAAGGFTQALLDAGAARVYSVDTGSGQLRGSLRVHPQVVNLERTNLGQIDRSLVPDTIDLLVMDLSYLSIGEAMSQIDGDLFAQNAELIALVKPTYELRASHLVTSREAVATAVRRAKSAVTAAGWAIQQEAPSAILGSRGAVEVFVHARRETNDETHPHGP